MGKHKQIVCLSTSNFYPYPTRKQNVMTRLSDAEIIYFDPPVTLLAPLKDKSARPRLTAWKQPGQPAADNITVYALPPVLPFFNKLRFINRLNQRRQAKYIRRRLREHGFDAPWLWCYSPTACDVHTLIPHSKLIYDCVDRHSAYAGLIDPALVDAEERELATACDVVFCTAQGLYETLREYNPRTHLIPNGAAYELFVQAAGEGRAEAAAHPVFGFIGMLQDCLAYDYSLALADSWPEAELRFIGRVMPGVDVSALQARPNIKLLGLVPQTELPALMREFDVCLNLFAPGRLSKDVSPLKFYEYLATGKPLVSTREPLQVNDYADIIYVADDIPAFLAACHRAAAENDPLLRQKRLAAGEQASWSRRVRQMEQILEDE